MSALGCDAASGWEALVSGQSCRVPLRAIAVEGCRVTEGAEARLPELAGVTEKELLRLSRASRLVLPAAGEALAHAGLLDEAGRCRSPRMELSLATTACGMEKGEEFLRAVWSGKTAGNTARVARYQAHQQVSELFGRFAFSGPSTIVANACASGANAIGHAADLIRCGMADRVLAGGYDALCELVFTGFDSLQSLSPDLCRPFDRGRNGLMLGEGAAFLVLEREECARERGARIHGVVAGYGHTTDRGHLTQPEQEGVPLERAMRDALAQAGVGAGEIGYVNAHGTGTPFNDGAEAKAFDRVFRGGATLLSSTKAAIGHTLGAAGAVEAVFGLQALATGAVPPQLNLRDPEPLVADALAGTGARHGADAVMSVNLGFGGSNAALVFSRA